MVTVRINFVQSLNFNFHTRSIVEGDPGLIDYLKTPFISNVA
jgi:hypothetical protein